MPARLRVVVPGFATGTVCCALLGLTVVAGRALIPESFLVCFGPALGPLAELLTCPDSDPGRAVGGAVVLATLIAFHPVGPSRASAVVSVLGIAVWFFWGLAYVYDGV